MRAIPFNNLNRASGNGVKVRLETPEQHSQVAKREAFRRF
jgi:hypothetical protein